jgi:ABC-2 type transport system ATP-binding protein
MIEVTGLTKRYRRTVAVDNLTFAVRPGRVTGFLGPNGAGKSTTLRLVLGLDTPTAGITTIDGRPFRDRRRGLRHVGALLDATAVQGGRTARWYLVALAASNGLPMRRVAAVLEQVGLMDVAERRIAGFSLGMKQRLGIAAALLGDPPVLIFDEPVNGLDPEGVRWLRDLLHGFAAEGRTVLVSSHLMSEMEHTADHLIVIGRGRLIADVGMREFTDRARTGAVTVGAAQPVELAAGLLADGAGVERAGDGMLTVTGLTSTRIGQIALERRIAVHHLAAQHTSLEDAFLDLTTDSTDYLAGEHR